MSVWNDFSEREKLEWLRARLAKIEGEFGALSRHVDEIGNAVRDIEEQLKKQDAHK